MKKTFKTFFACLAAATTAFTAVAFSACEDTDKNDGNEDNKQITDNTGNNDENENNKDTVAELLEKLDCDYAALSLESTSKEGSRDVVINGKINLDGSADIKAVMSQSGKEEKEYFYVLMRDWKVYGALDYKEITDFTAPDVYMYGIVDIIGKIEEGVAQSEVQIPMEVDVRALLNGLMQVDDLDEMLKLMHVAKAVSVTESAVTVDFNKAVYNVVSNVVNVINGLSATTTVGDILNNEKLKGFANALTGELDTEEVVKLITQVLTGLKQSDKFPAEAAVIIDSVADLLTKIKPDENSTLYEYIVKLLSSQELVDKINQMLNMPAGLGLAKKITQFTLGEILALAGQDPAILQQLKDSAAQILTKVSENSVTAEGVTVKNFAAVLNYDGEYNITSLTVSAEITEGVETQTPQFKITFEKSAFTDLVVLPNPLPEMPKDNEKPEVDGGFKEPVSSIDVKGKTFVYGETYLGSLENDWTDEQKASALEESQATIYKFNTDGTCEFKSHYYQIGDVSETYYYVQEGHVVYLYLSLEDKNEGHYKHYVNAGADCIFQFILGGGSNSYVKFVPQEAE